MDVINNMDQILSLLNKLAKEEKAIQDYKDYIHYLEHRTDEEFERDKALETKRMEQLQKEAKKKWTKR